MAAFNFHRRKTRRWWYAGATLMAAAFFTVFFVGAGAARPTSPLPPAGPYQVPTGPVGLASGFADSDGNTPATNSSSDYNPSTSTTNVAGQPNYDWNSIATNPSYSGTAPYQHAGGTTAATTNAGNGWLWTALTDAQATTTDTGFAGGTKQDLNCAPVIGTKAPNKDDLKRVYIAATTLTSGPRAGHTILNLGWVRIPQNTTSPSAHLAFEFNQGGSTCPTSASDGLVPRTAGDLLVLYDFTGGNVAPTITIDRWITSGTCDVSQDSSTDSNGGCWGPGTTLNGTQAEANVNTGLSHICDTTLSPTGCGPGESDTSDGTTTKGTNYVLPFQTSDSLAPATETLNQSEFGEAGIDLTAANIFTSASCTSFGQVEAVSRSSGSSGTAAMEDLVGPGTFTLSNCTTGISTTPQSDGTDTTAGTFADMTQDSTTKTWGTLTSGTWVRDTATVTVSPVTTWRGSVAFYLCSSTTTTLTSCSSTTGTAEGSQTVGAGGTNPPTNGNVATSSNTRLSAAGSYCWAAYFTGTSPTGLPAASSLTQECFTVTAPTSIATNPFFYPQDRVTISASSGGSLSGTVSWRLYDSLTDCNANVATVAGGLLYKEEPTSNNISGTSPVSVNTNNTTFRVTASTATMYWRVSYSSSNTAQTGSSSTCVENISDTIAADGTVTFP